MPDKEIVQLDPIISLSSDDLLLIVDDPASLNITSKITVANAFEYLTKGNLTATAPIILDQTRQVIGGAAVVSMAKATTAVDGYLSSTDWNTFNDKEPALTKGNLTATSPLVLSQTRQVIGGAAAVSIPVATTSVDGYLAAADWTTFNAKQAALSFPLAATLGGTGVNNAGTLTNATATTITGGGTLALGGYTLTVPATGTAALLATANVFTTQQMIDGTSDQIQLRIQANAVQTTPLINLETSAAASLYSIDALGHTGAGIATDANRFFNMYKIFDGTTTQYGMLFTMFANPTANEANILYGMSFSGRKLGSKNHGFIWGIRGIAAHQGTAGTLTSAISFYGQIALFGVSGDTGTITTGDCFYAEAPTRTTGNLATITTQNGFLIANQGAAFVTNAYGINISSISGAATINSAITTNAGNIVFNEGGDANTDFRVESDAYDALFVDGSNDSVMVMSNVAGKVGFYGVTAIAQQTHIADPVGGVMVDAEARTAINAILVRLETLGLIASA